MAHADIAKETPMQYLKRREIDMNRIHPQWQMTNSEINASQDLLKRNGEPICIPPSWDLIKKYAGARCPKSDGFDAVFYNEGIREYRGDHGEASFLKRMQGLKLGGILIGNVDSIHMRRGELAGQKSGTNEYVLPKPLAKLVCEVESETVNPKFEERKRYFELDFVFIHPNLGIYHIEVKSSSDERGTSELLEKGIDQLKKRRLELLFKKFCELIGTPADCVDQLWTNFNADGAVVFEKSIPSAKGIINGQKNGAYDVFVNDDSNQPFEAVMRKKMRSDQNFFRQNNVYKYFTIFLCTYRPDFFICPVQCVLQTYANILSHKVNAINYYRNNDAITLGKNFDIYFKVACLDFLSRTKPQQMQKYARAVQQQNIQEILVSNELDSEEYEMIAKSQASLTDAGDTGTSSSTLLATNLSDDPSQVDGWTVHATSSRSTAPESSSNNRNNNVARQPHTSSDTLAEVTRDLLKGLNIASSKNTLLKDLRQQILTRLTTRQNISMSARQYLEELRLNGLIKHSDVVFSDEHKHIYFTEQQQRAIDVWNKDGELCNTQQIIEGPPGSGKTVILLMKLFILKQIRKSQKLIFSSWHKHDEVVKKFVQRNRCTIKNCCREVEFQTEHRYAWLTMYMVPRPKVTMANGYTPERDLEYNQTKGLERALNDIRYDVVLDERIPENKWERFISGTPFAEHSISIAVPTGGFRLSKERYGNITGFVHSTELRTIFRSTNQIQDFFHQYYNPVQAVNLHNSDENAVQATSECRVEAVEYSSGHNFEGVAVEERTFSDEVIALTAVEQRLVQLCSHLGLDYTKKNLAVIVESSAAYYRLYNYQKYMVYNFNDVPSLEFPVVVNVCVEKSKKEMLHIISSRAICHLIVFSYERMSNRTYAIQNSGCRAS